MLTCCTSAVDPARAPLPTRAVRTFTAARVFTHQQGLPTRAAWRAWARTSARPVDIPMRPDVVYKGCSWYSWHDWLGTVRPSRTWRPFPEARAHAQSLHLAGARAWRAWSQTGARPYDIPSNPNKAYRDAGWPSWGDWLGTDRRAVAHSVLLPFDEARAYARRLGLSSQQAWADWVKTDARPAGIPVAPAHTYQHRGWTGWRDWLGATYGTPRPRRFQPFTEARAYVRTLGLRTAEEWYRWAATDARPADIPAHPARTYRDEGWVGFRDWLGRPEAGWIQQQ